MSVRRAIVEAAGRLAAVSDTPRLDAELLMAHALLVSREALLLKYMDAAAPEGFASLINRRMASEPVAYITGTRDFWTLSLRVTPDVLVPRPDTETLIEAAVARIAPNSAPRFLDLGTGSGALLLAALDQWPQGWGVGVDRSEAAARVAADNARQLGFGDRAAFVIGDWASAISGTFDGIFCNPPYIKDAAPLPLDVAEYEPASALFAGADGLADYRRIIPQLPDLLALHGCAFLETGYDQAQDVAGLAMAQGMMAEVQRDLAGQERCVILKLR